VNAPLPLLVAVLGPTASGKTGFAVALARAVGGEIINCDSRQVYDEMSIGTARPTAGERADVPHHLFGIITPNRQFSAHDYRAAALHVLHDVWTRGRLPILCGGTGHYHEALTLGLPPAPPPDPRLRHELEQLLHDGGCAALQERLRRLDPGALAIIDINNPRRLTRAIELITALNLPLAEIRAQRVPLPARTENLLIAPDRDSLNQRINARVATMLAAGLEAEVRALVQRYGEAAPGLTETIGYREWLPHLQSATVDHRAVAEAIALATRQYARRQFTWFKRSPGGPWLDPTNPATLSQAIATIESIRVA